MPINQNPTQNPQDPNQKPMRPDEYRPGDLPNEPYRDVPLVAGKDKVGTEHSKSDKSGKSDSSCGTKVGGKDSGCC